MKAIVVLVAIFALANANSLFLDKEEANQILSREKRANSGFEELQQGNLQQECYDEQCSYEEAREVFEDDAQTDAFWQILTNQCKSNPCSEPGTADCVNIYNGHVCLCKEGFTGRECEFEINYCENDPCLNGKCYNDPPTYKCVCEPGYKGDICNEDVNECVVDNPCENDALCINEVGDFRCECSEGFTGKTCATDVNECNENPCENESQCNNKYGSYECTCLPGYSGKNCEIEVNECEFGYCPEGSTCVDGINKFECLCPKEGCTAKPKKEAPKKKAPKIKGQ